MSQRILITGASGAIGSALAVAYARQDVVLYLLGRNEGKLKHTAALCERQGATVSCHLLDLTQLDQIAPLVEQVLTAGAVDLLIANAGMNSAVGADGMPEAWADVSRLIDLNLKANMALVDAFLPSMLNRGQGQIALISSLAGYFGLPHTPAYCASKAGLKAYGESLRGWLGTEGIRVNVVMPGFVASDMGNVTPGPKPFRWAPERAAQAIVQGLARDKSRISFPFPLNLGAWFLAVLPSHVSIRILGWLGY